VTLRGRHFLQLPGPSNVPDRILRSIDKPTIDHRGPEFAELGAWLLAALKRVFKTEHDVIMYPGSATGGWESAMVNTLSSGDHVLMFDQGFFTTTWRKVVERFGLTVDMLDADWRRPIDVAVLHEALANDTEHQIKAVAIVHNETSTGVTNLIPPIRAALDDAGHPALLFVDAVSSLPSMPYEHDAWGVDVTVVGSQKGFMLPPGLAFTAVSPKAMAATADADLPRSYWRWDEMLGFNDKGFFPYTPATNLLYGLKEAIVMLEEEGLANVWARHHRLGEATRHAVAAWGLECYCTDAEARSDTVTAVAFPDSHNANDFRDIVRDQLNMSLGGGLGPLKGEVVRIGHLGDFNELMLLGTLGGFELGLKAAGVPHSAGGVQAAIEYLRTGGA